MSCFLPNYSGPVRFSPWQIGNVDGLCPVEFSRPRKISTVVNRIYRCLAPCRIILISRDSRHSKSAHIDLLRPVELTRSRNTSTVANRLYRCLAPSQINLELTRFSP